MGIFDALQNSSKNSKIDFLAKIQNKTPADSLLVDDPQNYYNH